jgi:DNA-binding SARP family transcriptional activator
MIRLQLLGGLAVGRSDSSPETPTKRRRNLAVLTIVAAAAPRPVARDKILALLWPESDDERARNSLRQELYALRRDLGEELFLPESAAGLQLDPAHIEVDLWEFRARLAAGAYADAVAAYRGPFLDGFHVPGVGEFSHWLDGERLKLEQEYMKALETLAANASREGRHADVVAWRRRQAAADPASGRYALALMRALAEAGDRSGAIKHAAAHDRALREQLDAEPDAEVMEFVASLRRAGWNTPRSSEAVIAEAMSAPLAEEPTATSDGLPAKATATETLPLFEIRAHRPPTRRRWPLVAAAGTLLLVSGGWWFLAARNRGPAVPPEDAPVILGSARGASGGRDPGNRLIACDGPMCPAGALPQDAFVVVKHPAYAPPTAGTAYIAPVSDATTLGEPGYKCCTTATFENAFKLPRSAVSATISVAVHVDNWVIVRINGMEFGRHDNRVDGSHFAGEASVFRKTFSPDPSGTNRLQIVLLDGGGAGGLHYDAVVTFELVADADGDGVADGADAVPSSDRRPTLMIGKCDAGISNQALSDPRGATMNDRVEMVTRAVAAEARPKAVETLAEEWMSAARISSRDQARIATCAAQLR